MSSEVKIIEPRKKTLCMAKYDRVVNTFSPQGRLFQVEYAIEAIKDLSLAETETIVVSILKQIMEEKVTPNNVDFAKVAPAYHLYTPQEGFFNTYFLSLIL